MNCLELEASPHYVQALEWPKAKKLVKLSSEEKIVSSIKTSSVRVVIYVMLNIHARN